MAKEEVHNWMRTAILLLGIVFAGGGYAMKISDNTVKVNKANDKIDSVEDDVHRIELNAKDTRALAETAARNSAESKVMFGKVMEHLEEQTKVDTEMQVKMGKIETKVDSLIQGN